MLDSAANNMWRGGGRVCCSSTSRPSSEPAAGFIMKRLDVSCTARPITLFALCAILVACAMPSRVDTSAMSFSREPLVGKIVWIDLITHDLDASRRFYAGLFGWTFEETAGPMGGKYLVARSGEIYVAGMLLAERPADGTNLSRWLPYASVQDVDAAATRSVSLGGRVAVEPRDVALGRVAAIVDPQGAVIGLARSSIGDPDDATTKPDVGRRVWTELLSNDPLSSADFYAALVGFEVRRIERRGGEYTFLVGDGKDRAGILANPTEDWSPLWLTSFGVQDAGIAASRAKALGGRVLLDQSDEVRGGTIAIVADPSGAVLVLQQITPGAEN